MNLTQPSERFDTLGEAEDTLKHQGFKLVADICNWIDEDGLIDAGIYPVEGAYCVSKFRIEYRTLNGKRGVMAGPSHTPVEATRRRFLSQAAGVAAGASVLALATIPPAAAAPAPAGLPDPVFRLIEAHRTARAAYLVARAEQDRLDRIGDRSGDWVAAAQFEADIDALNDLIETAATTFAGLRAWASYLDEIRDVDEDMLEEVGPTPALVATLVEALANLAVAS
jgi:hypothetical protein